MILRRVARPMLASVFVVGAVDTLRDPGPKVELARPVLDRLLRGTQIDAEAVVKLDAVVKLGAGTLLALGRFPRLSAFVLAVGMVPTSLAGHRYWEQKDPAERASHQFHFLKNLALTGGLLIAAADTHGHPSLGWRASRAVRRADKKARDYQG
jgi:putative oxidoreductase